MVIVHDVAVVEERFQRLGADAALLHARCGVLGETQVMDGSHAYPGSRAVTLKRRVAQGMSLRAPVIASRALRVYDFEPMLPPPDANADLPPGVHAAGWSEIEERFGKGSAARVRALATLRHLHELAVRTACLRNFHVFGSFVSGVPEPRDVDVVLVMNAGFRLEECPQESRSLFSHAEAEARYGASIFWLRGERGSEAAMRDFLLGWQIKRDGTLRGILEVA